MNIIIFVVSILGTVCSAGKPKIECGYKQCPPTREGTLNVHLIPHSHMDAGWVKTFDEYYYGTKTSISSANVQLIYHSVLSELLHDKRRKFTFSETGYFWRWWKEQRPVTRATFRTLVQEGRVEFAGGGWVHNDEATVNYLQIIDQFTWGLRKLNDTLGPCGKPKTGWQIDTYGHTREQASLLAQMGYDGLFIGRVDYKERESMVEEDRMEFMWRGSDVLGKMSDIMTHTLFNLYNAPEGFCFDFLCNDEPIIDDPDSKVYNADARVNDFIAQIERQAKYYDHDNIMVMMGGDFTYQSAANWFMNMDKLINHVNTHPANISDINIFYSTPSCYLKAIYLYGRRDKAMYTENGDYLPYGSDTKTYWTGYYTSRPSLKYLASRAHNFLQVVKQLTVITRMGDSFELHLLRHAVSLVLHHDAITGTSQQHVTNDFVRILSEAIDSCTKKVSNLLTTLTPTWGNSRRTKNSQQFIACHQLNISECRFLESQDTILLLLYNPSSIKTYHYVRIPAIALHYTIRDFNDEEVEYQLVPLPGAVINLPGRSSSAIQELFFEAENIPPLGYSAFYITPEENSYKKKSSQSINEAEQEITPHISNEYLRVKVNKETGLLEYIQHVDGVSVQVSQNFYYYSSQQTIQSGAYSFSPEKERPTPVTERVSYHTVRGSLVKEIRQRFNDWITQVIRLYRGEEFVEMEWIVGPVPIGADRGKEVVSVFTTNISNNGEFYTDSNGRQMMKRSCWNDSSSHHKRSVASCYYPVTSRICIHSLNSSIEMCVLPDRAQGGTSLNEGEIELMLHRRLLTDDGFGLEETLNEEAHGVGLTVKGRHRIYFGNFRQEIDELTFSERMAQAARRWKWDPWMFFASGDKTNRRKWQNVRNKRYSSLRLHGLPRHVHILTLEPWKSGSVLLRLENTLENPVRGNIKEKLDHPDDFPSRSSHITVDLKKIFLQLPIRMVRETTLAANQWLDDARQMDWSTRYVYSGGDDGILPEDAEQYSDRDESEKPREPKESVYSNEEDTTRKKASRLKNTKSKTKFRNPRLPPEYDRRKRSLNNTEQLNENMINETFKNTNTLNSSRKDNNSLLFISNNVTSNYVSSVPDILSNVTTESFKKFSIINQVKGVTMSPNNRFWSSVESENEDMVSDEEDFSANLRKRSPKRNRPKNQRKRPADTPTVGSDDDVTKSIYEMYYKTTKVPNSKPPSTVNGFRRKKKKTRRYRQNNEYDNPGTLLELPTNRIFKNKTKKKLKHRNIDMPFFLEDKRRNEEENVDVISKDKLDTAEEYVGQAKKYTRATVRNRRDRKRYSSASEDEDDEDNEDDEYFDEEDGARRKRALPREDETSENGSSEGENQTPDMDFIITLRPTQIRTFVVWFHDIKKKFVA